MASQKQMEAKYRQAQSTAVSLRMQLGSAHGHKQLRGSWREVTVRSSRLALSLLLLELPNHQARLGGFYLALLSPVRALEIGKLHTLKVLCPLGGKLVLQNQGGSLFLHFSFTIVVATAAVKLLWKCVFFWSGQATRLPQLEQI